MYERFFEVAKNMNTENKELWSETVARDMLIEPEEAEKLIMPEYATKNAAGADMKCAQGVIIPSIWKTILKVLLNQEEKIKPTLVHTGIKAYMQDDEVLYIFNRSSGPNKRGLILANSTGVIDADYYGNKHTDGEIMFAFYNIFPWDIEIKIGDAIGQGVFQKILRDDRLFRGGERIGGFGSTDSKHN